ncbi:MAG TPA: sulfatase-like hydrolase/transferase, partial [Opitutaceae bacterium]|nr:sulfatase-like hydrolase/transferase [Opitutaceae bacterium]
MNLPPDPASARTPDLPGPPRHDPQRETSSAPGLAATLGVDFALWLATLVILGLLRWGVILCFVGDVTLADALQATFRGARFDAVIAGLLVLPSTALGLAAWLSGRRLGADRMRAALLAVSAIFLSIVYVVDFGFFAEFGCRLDQRVLAASDDWHALIQTIWARHHPLLALLATVALATLWWWVARSACRLRLLPFDRLGRVRHPVGRGLIVLAAGCLLVGSIRGLSFGETPVRIRNSFVTGNQRLNRTIPTPFATLLHDLEGREAVLAPPSPSAIQEALAVWRASTGAPAVPARAPVTGQLHRTARGALRPPRQVFLIILEGQHGFPLLPAYRSLGLQPGLAGLADDGAYFTRFLPAAEQTDHALAVLLAGLLVPSTNVLHAPRTAAPFATSLAPQFARLGYLPRFFYGGYLGWSRLEQFATGQGFSEVYGAGQIRGASGNAWGVWDEFLFDYILTKVDPAKPGLNVIMTTTNHSPYDLDPARRRPVPPPPGPFGAWDAATRAVVEH